MDKLEQKILDSASTGGSPSSIGAQILEKGVGRLDTNTAPETQKTAEEITKENDALVVNILQEVLKDSQQNPEKDAPPRGGRGRQAGPELGSAIKNALQEGTPEEAPIDPADLAKKLKEKDNLLVNLADLRVREKQAQAENLSEEKKAGIQDNLRNTQKRLLELNRELPSFDPMADQERIQQVIKEWADANPAASSAIQKEAPAINEEAKLIESLKNGEGYVVGGDAALSAIDALMEKQEEELAIVPPEPQSATPVSGERIIESAKEIFQNEGVTNAPAEQAPQTQDPYAKAMDNHWAEIEATRKAAEQSTGEDLTLEPRLPETASTEKIEPAPEGEAGPHLVAPKQEPVTIEGIFSKIGDTEIVPSLNPLEATAVMSPEQAKQIKLEKIRAKLDAMTGAVETRAEKTGMLDKVRKIGEMWNKVPKRYKYMLAGGALLSGVGAAAAGSAVGMGAIGALGTALRGLSGAGLFVTFETILKNNYEKKMGGERSKATETRHMLIASLGAVAFAALVPKMISDYMGSEVVQTGTHEAVAHASATAPKIEYVVGQGETLWGGITEKLDEQGLLAGMQEGQKTYVIDALKDKFAAMSPEELRLIGIGSGNIDVIHPGDHIDLTKVLGDTQLTSEITHHAQGLSAAQVYSIEHPIASPVAPEMPLEAPAPETAAVIPAEIVPTDPAIVAAAEDITKNYVNEQFGTKGFLGFGAQDGMDSIHWKDSEVGFANQPVDKVLAAHPSAFPAGGGQHFGIEDYSATQKMQAGLLDVQKETGVNPRPSETVADYLKRSAITALSEQAATEPTTYRT